MNRESNIELLRIVLLFGVILTHGMGSYMSHISVFDYKAVSWGWVYALTRPAVNIFVLISGYYSIGKTLQGISVINKIGRLLLQTLPAVFLIYFMMNIAGMPVHKIVFRFIADLVTVQNSFFHFWYLECYVILYLLAPYLNKLLNLLSQKEYLNLIFISSLLFIIFSSVNDLAGINLIYGYTYSSFTEMKSFNFIIFINLYMIGGYIRKYGFPALSRKYLVAIIVITGAIVSVLTMGYSFGYTPRNFLHEYLKGESVSHDFNFYQAFFKYNNIFIFVLSILLFALFKGIRIRNNWIINMLGHATSGAYVLHVIMLTAMYSLFCNGGEYPYWNSYHENIITILAMSILSFIGSLTLAVILNSINEKKYK